MKTITLDMLRNPFTNSDKNELETKEFRAKSVALYPWDIVILATAYEKVLEHANMFIHPHMSIQMKAELAIGQYMLEQSHPLSKAMVVHANQLVKILKKDDRAFTAFKQVVYGVIDQYKKEVEEEAGE